MVRLPPKLIVRSLQSAVSSAAIIASLARSEISGIVILSVERGNKGGFQLDWFVHDEPAPPVQLRELV